MMNGILTSEELNDLMTFMSTHATLKEKATQFKEMVNQPITPQTETSANANEDGDKNSDDGGSEYNSENERNNNDSCQEREDEEQFQNDLNLTASQLPNSQGLNTTSDNDTDANGSDDDQEQYPLHLQNPDFTQAERITKVTSSYIIVFNIHTSDHFLIKIGITQETVDYLIERYRTSYRYFAYRMINFRHPVDKTGMHVYDTIMKTKLESMQYLEKFVLTTDFISGLEVNFNDIEMTCSEPTYITTGEVFMLKTTTEDTVFDLLKKLSADLLVIANEATYAPTKELQLRKQNQPLVNELFYESNKRGSCFAKVLYLQGHFNPTYHTEDVANFPLSSLSVRNLCIAFHTSIKKGVMKCQDRNSMWTLTILWVGIGEDIVNKNVHSYFINCSNINISHIRSS
jgi:hypothetical protein